VHPIDTARGRRPVARPSPGGHRQARPSRAAHVGTLLFPHGEPDLPDAMHAGGEQMDLAYAVSVLMGLCDFLHRMAAETGVDLAA
jgi:hypothetical protein